MKSENRNKLTITLFVVYIFAVDRRHSLQITILFF